MKRSASCSKWLIGVAIACLLIFTAGGAFSADQQPGANPLRAIPRKSESRSAPVANAAAVGTSVRAKISTSGDETPPQVAKSVVAKQGSSHTQQKVKPAAYRRRVTNSGRLEPTPYHEELNHTSILQGTVTVQEQPGEFVGEEAGCADCAGRMFAPDAMGGIDHCCGGVGCYQCCLIPCPTISLDDLAVFAGAHGFTGPMNRGQTGSFGFNEGLNWGGQIPCMNNCWAMQFGARFTQSNLSGAEFTPDIRHQTFLTGGVFRRVDWGLQGGVVFDYLNDDWYTDTDLTQLRAEVGWVFPCAQEIGFWMTASLDENTAVSQVISGNQVVPTPETWEATDLYAFYYRHRFQDWEGAMGRVYAGFTGAGDGFLGADFRVPLACDLALETGFAYLVPEENKGPVGTGNEQESWNVAVGLVWYPGCGTAVNKSYCAPLLNVADNGSFMVDKIR